MELQTDGQEAGTEAEAIAETPQVETHSDATAEQPTGAETPGEPDAGDEPEPKRVPWFQKRIDEVTRQKYEAQREADYLRGLLDAQGRSNPQPQQKDGPPKEDQFEDYEQYQAALIDYRVEQRLQAKEAESQRSSVRRTYEERVARLREAKPDYDEVVGDRNLPITPLMAEVIRESEVGPEVAYFLGTNRTEAARIANLPPHRQAAELGRLEARLTVEPKAQTKQNIPPPPPATVHGLSAGLTKGLEDMSMAEYIANAKKEGRI